MAAPICSRSGRCSSRCSPECAPSRASTRSIRSTPSCTTPSAAPARRSGGRITRPSSDRRSPAGEECPPTGSNPRRDVVWALEQSAGDSSCGDRAPRVPPRAGHGRADPWCGQVSWRRSLAHSWAWRGGADGRGPHRRSPHRSPGSPGRCRRGCTLGSAPVVSPDGSRIAFVGYQAPTAKLYVRARASSDATAVVGSEGARQPFWSPDGRSIGFFARGKLMKVALDGGAPVALADAPDGRGGTWSPSGVIVFQPDYLDAGLARISADGGEVLPATLLDPAHDELTHKWPAFLPDGVHFIYFVTFANRRSARRLRRPRRSPRSGARGPAVRLGIRSRIRAHARIGDRSPALRRGWPHRSPRRSMSNGSGSSAMRESSGRPRA